MTKVAIIQPSNEWYGADVMAWQLATALSDAGCVPCVIVPSEFLGEGYPLSQRLEDRGISVHKSALPALRRSELTPHGILRLLCRIPAALRAARESRSELIVVNTSALALLIPALRLFLPRTRVVAYVHEFLMDPSERHLLGNMLGLAHEVVAISQSVHGSLPRRARARSVIVPDAVPDRGPVTDLPPGPAIRFLFIGRLTQRKGIAALIEAWGAPKATERTLTILGGAPPKGRTAAVDWSSLSHHESVQLVGEVANAARWIDESHVVIVPSLLPEGLGLVAIEALERGRPVVFTDVPGLVEVVDEEVGWRLPIKASPEAWRKVLSSITLSEVEARAVGTRPRFERTYNRNTYVEAICALISRNTGRVKDAIHE